MGVPGPSRNMRFISFPTLLALSPLSKGIIGAGSKKNPSPGAAERFMFLRVKGVPSLLEEPSEDDHRETLFTC